MMDDPELLSATNIDHKIREARILKCKDPYWAINAIGWLQNSWQSTNVYSITNSDIFEFFESTPELNSIMFHNYKIDNSEELNPTFSGFYNIQN